jgi:hypothetical protein
MYHAPAKRQAISRISSSGGACADSGRVWQRLWADVQALLEKAGGKGTKGK